MARRKLIAGNWKMHKTVAESVGLAGQVAVGLKNRQVDVLVAPTALALAAVASRLAGTPVMLAAQNLFWEAQGAYTGEVSGPLIRAAGASHVIIGHSERRQYFGESEKTAGLRVAAALAAGLVPILCVGETLARFYKKVAKATRILYGGSVKPANAAGLLTQSEVDGALVGGASLNVHDFLGIIEAV
ncbi:MAG: triosephosphate isomerase [Desulfarculus sp.]|nr:triosephosphate isomerase [Desulfarculus sp.]